MQTFAAQETCPSSTLKEIRVSYGDMNKLGQKRDERVAGRSSTHARVCDAGAVGIVREAVVAVCIGRRLSNEQIL